MSKQDQAKSIAAKLSTLSKSKNIPYQNIATVFLLERLLARLLVNPMLAKSLVFKGGYVGLRVYNSLRHTMDLDALLMKADIPKTLKQTVKAIETDIDDGVWFLFESQIDLQTQGEYGGIRQIFRAGIGELPKDKKRTQIVNFDIGIGDPVTPGPIAAQTSEIIGESNLSWQVYPIETIAAEKLQTLLERGGGNSRSKDVFDLYFYLPKVDSKKFRTAVEKCFEFRETEMPSNPSLFLSQINPSLLKQGWKSATASLKKSPDFKEAFDGILRELNRLFPHVDEKKSNENERQ